MGEITGKDLKILRIQQGLTQAELADRVGMDAATIAHFERGDYALGIDAMYELCDALGDTRIWQEWMCQRYPTSYGMEHPIVRRDVDTYAGAVANLLTELADVVRNEDALMRDAVDNKPDERIMETLESEIREAIDAAENLLRIVRKEGK